MAYILCNSVCGRAITIRNFLRLDRLLICLDIEVDEETEVAGEQEASEQGSSLRARTRSHDREFSVREVCCSEIRVS